MTCPTAPSPDPAEPDESFERIIWDRDELLKMTDSVRTSIAACRGLGQKADDLSDFLEKALKDEDRRAPSLNFATLEYAHLDKLLTDLRGLGDASPPSNLASELSEPFWIGLVTNATKLESAWGRRFGEEYIMIDQYRCTGLFEDRLKHINYLNCSEDESRKWNIGILGPVSEVEGNLQFDLGQ